MSAASAIEWCDATWQVVSGCTPVSEGCRNCYSAALCGGRLKNNARTSGLVDWVAGGPARRSPKGEGGRFVFNGAVRCHDDQLAAPLHMRAPKRIFVADRGDLFHAAVPDAFLGKVFDTMERADRHVFQLLTKRSGRLRTFIRARYGDAGAPAHIWPGVSIEDQPTADARLPDLLAIRASVRWVSYEPALGPVDFRDFLWDATGRFRTHRGRRQIQLVKRAEAPAWIVMGYESGPGARCRHPAYARQTRDACAAAGVPFFFKQWGAWVQRGQAPDRDASILFRRQRAEVLDNGSLELLDPPADWVDQADFYDEIFVRVGKKAAGAVLDGREHRELPA